VLGFVFVADGSPGTPMSRCRGRFIRARFPW